MNGSVSGHAPAEVPAEVGVLMFDFYGTVVDMQTGLTEVMEPYLRSKGHQANAGRLVTLWRRTHFQNSMIDALLHREHTSYREIGRRALAYTLERSGVPHSDEEVRALVGQIGRLRPFEDVPAAMDRLRTRYQLVVLSNGDPDLLDEGVAYAGVPFYRVISVAEAGSFKPHVATYRKASELLDVSAEQVLFVANHAFDCVGAKAFGMRTAFVNRRKVPFGETPHQPDLEVQSFEDLAGALVPH